VRLAAYPKYKPSGVAWLGEIPEHWENDAAQTLYIDSRTDRVSGIYD